MSNFIILLIALFARIILVLSAVHENGETIEDDFVLNITDFVEIYGDARRNETAFEENIWTGAKLVLDEKTNEIKANEIFMKYKLEELSEYRNVTSENPAAMYYYDAKDKIEKSKVYQIIKKMPKGANLYIHALGSVSSEWLVKNFSYIDELKICSNGGFNEFTFRKGANFVDCKKINSFRKYDCTGTYDNKLKKFFDLEALRPKGRNFYFEEAVNHLFWMFVSISDAVNYKPAFEQFHYQMLQEMYDDNIMYAEVRTGFAQLYDNNNNKYTREDTVKTLINVVRKFKKTHEDFLGVKFIFAIVRHSLREEVEEEIEVFKKLKKKFPKHIIGVDFVGWEDYGASLNAHLKDFIKLKMEGYNLFLLAGETNLHDEISDHNLYDALLLQSKRIGHGYALWKHPVIMSEIISKSIPIEICPATNQISGLVVDLRNHPGGIYLSESAPLVIGNDSPGFLGITGLSTDFYYTIMSLASNKADLRTLKQLALNSLKYSTLSKQKVENAIKLFTEKWNKFLDDVVQENNAM